jgi:DNA-binding Xre family transcriptional regulator
MNTLRERIIKRLDDLEMRRADLARATGLSRASVSNIINGKTKKMSSETLFLIAGALKCNPGWIRDGQGPQDMKLMQASETRTIEKLRQLPAGQLAIIETLLDSMLEQEKKH